MARKAIYNNQELEIANDALTPEQVKDAFANTSYPELKNATAYTDEDGNIRFQLQAGTKGARKAIYNNQELEIANDALTPDQVKDAFANTSYPELKNATAYTDEDGNIRFQLQAGTKGARKAIYNNQELDIANDALTPDQVKDAFANTSYPELKNATAYLDEDGNIRFQLQAGTKGN